MSARSLLAATIALAGLAASASAQTVINSVPYTINTSGKYVLGNNLITASADQIAITINAPNVILDLNEFFVSGPGNTPNSIRAVISVANVSNVTIRRAPSPTTGLASRSRVAPTRAITWSKMSTRPAAISPVSASPARRPARSCGTTPCPTSAAQRFRA